MNKLFFAWQLTALISGVLASGVMLFYFTKSARVRVHPGSMFMCIFMSTTIASLMRVGLHTWFLLLTPKDDGGPIPATISRVAIEQLGHDAGALEAYAAFFFWGYLFFSTSATLWYLMLALDLIFSLSNPFLPFHTDNVKHHIVAWPISLLYCLVFRYVLGYIQLSEVATVVLYYNLPAYLVLLYIGGALIQSRRRIRILESHAHATTERMAKRILPFLAIFAAHTIVAFVIFLVQLGTEFGSLTIDALDQLSLVLESLILFALFCHNAGIFKASRSKVSNDFNASPLDAQTNMDVVEGPMLRSTSEEMASPPNSNGTDKMDVSNKLRMDVMRYMSKGIMRSIEMAQAVERNAFRSSSSAEYTGSANTDAAIDGGGGYSSVSYKDYTHVESMGVVVVGEKGGTMLSFRDCAPKIFHRIRAQFNINQDFYRESFDPLRILSEHGSEGKSGNIFYFTANKQFMVKSVPKEEFDTLRAILPNYHEYLQSNPNSMLGRYFGCHSISLPIGKRRMYFVVMQNLFNEGPVDQRYDLKGNRDRRQAVSAATMEGLIEIAKNRKAIDHLLMDIDFLKISPGIFLSYTKTAFLQDQLCSDFVFLASRGIIDYSILLGVRYEKSQQSRSHQNAIMSHDEKEVYYIGIVDMLQRYNWRWTVQRWLLGCFLCKDTHDVSAVPANEYASRLADFVHDKLFDIQGNARSRVKSSHDESKFTNNSGYSSESSRVSSLASSPYSFMSVAILEPKGVPAMDILRMPVHSNVADLPGLELSSLSPSGAYSSVCESP
ncbi:hypothetical protein CCR75_004803 [Bremia lactucae]|uniref:PIPK domain-containing protein n=1 Tax=Bremia lactucae TaxID=4779 RepID=A0A976IDK5_BRELC|nr:hypothetical protein CCR75_004803 [Bremia lactucae]